MKKKTNMLLGFKKRFREPILIGTKVFTIRKRRKIMPKVGDQLSMYTGLRTTNCEVITKKEVLQSMQNVRLQIWTFLNHAPNKKLPGYDYLFNGYGIRIFVDRKELTRDQIMQFVKFDGFKDTTDFAEYWLQVEGKKTLKKRTGGLMVIFHWTDLKY